MGDRKRKLQSPAGAARALIAESNVRALCTTDDVKEALRQRIEYFAGVGCRLSDHSFGSPDFTVWDESAAEEAMRKALAGEQLLDYEVAAYQSYMMDFLGEQYADHGWAMQMHMGAIRNLNGKLYRALGPDVGGWIDKGMAPADYDGIGQIIEDICFNNVWHYIGLNR